MDMKAEAGEVKNEPGHTQSPRLGGQGRTVCGGPQVPFLLLGVQVCPAELGWVHRPRTTGVGRCSRLVEEKAEAECT